MTIPVCDLISCVNTSIAAVTTCDLTLLQLSSVAKDFDTTFVSSVWDVASLPDAALNKGRMIYVQSVCGYRISDGVTWSNDFTSTQDNFQIWSWGCNDLGRLGDNTTVNKSSPVSVVAGFSDWCTLSSGYRHTVAVRTNGSAWAWGQNSQGQLGDNTTSNRSSPVSVVGGITNWCQASGGGLQSSAVRSNGSLWSWGSNLSGRLGDNSTTCSSSPVSVVGGFTDWTCTSAGLGFNLAIRSNKSLWAWGANSFGHLGDNTTDAKSSPVSVVGGFSDWCSISAGDISSLAVRTNGTAWAWGSGANGRLGDNTTTCKSSPVSVVGGFTDWCDISVGRNHGLAVRTNGTAWAWGYNCSQLGDNTSVERSSPVSVVGGFTNWCQVRAGTFHSVGSRSNGTVWSWGFNIVGQLGDNSNTTRSSPVSVVGAATDWYKVAAGREHTVALRSTRGFA